MQPFGEIAVRQDSPCPSGTPLINAGGKGFLLIFGAFVVGSAYQEIATGLPLAMTWFLIDSATIHPRCHPERAQRSPRIFAPI